MPTTLSNDGLRSPPATFRDRFGQLPYMLRTGGRAGCSLPDLLSFLVPVAETPPGIMVFPVATYLKYFMGCKVLQCKIQNIRLKQKNIVLPLRLLRQIRTFTPCNIILRTVAFVRRTKNKKNQQKPCSHAAI